MKRFLFPILSNTKRVTTGLGNALDFGSDRLHPPSPALHSSEAGISKLPDITFIVTTASYLIWLAA
jgi:hypothetical protein